jgi:hypothetical protein
MIYMPPQHGKSELATRILPAFLLGRNPALKIAIESYSDTIATKFNKDVQRIIDSEDYQKLFPNTILSTGNDGFQRNTDLVDVVGTKGYLKTTGIGGSLTSISVDVNILDDPFKDREQATSRKIQQKVYDQYFDVIRTRLHNDSQELLIMTRWDVNDIAGHLLRMEPGEWEVLVFEGIKDKINDPRDPRQKGQALWPEKHSLTRLKKVEKDNPVTFISLYQQNPGKPKHILVFPNWEEVDEIPAGLLTTNGGDFGFTADPATLVRCAVHNKCIYWDEVFYKRGMSNAAIAAAYDHAKVSKKVPSYWDPSEPKDIDDLCINYGINAIGADNSHARITEIREDYKLYITKRSHNLKRELQHYSFVVIGNEVTNEIEANQEDHAIDAGRYGYAGSRKNGKAKSSSSRH